MQTTRQRFLPSIPILFLAFGCGVTPGSPSRAQPAPSPPRKLALLIGIQAYDDSVSGWSALRGPRNDLDLLTKVLTSPQYGFDKANIVQLIDGDATRARISREFARLAEERVTSPEDIVYIHYSGHGSRVTDANGDEPRSGNKPGRDSTLVPYDARNGGSFEILDDELGIWLDRVRVRTPNVVFVVDACHSGSITRGASSARTRTAPDEDTRDYSWSSTPKLLEDMEKARTRVFPVDRFVRISAAKDDQTASEYEAEDGKQYGLLTWCWCRALAGASPGDSYGTVYNRVEALLRRTRRGAQRPHLEGAQNALLFQSRIEEPRRELTVAQADNRLIRFYGGLLSGVTEGSVYEQVHAAGPDAARARAKITFVDAETAEAEVLVAARVGVGDSFREIHRALRFPPLAVEIWQDGGNTGAWASKIDTQVRATQGLVRVQANRTPDLVLRLSNRRTIGQATASGDGLVCEFLDATERPFGGGAIDPRLLTMRLSDADDDAKLIVANIRRLENNRSILGFTDDLLRERPGAKVEMLRVTVPGLADPRKFITDSYRDHRNLDDDRIRLRTLGEGGDLGANEKVPRGGILAFRVTNDTNDALYFYLANMTPDGRVGILVGEVDDKDALVEKNSSRVLAPVAITDEPGLLDRYIWLITDQRVDIWRLKGEALSTRGPTEPKGSAGDLDALLSRISDVGARGETLVTTTRSALAARRFDVRITEPEP